MLEKKLSTFYYVVMKDELLFKIGQSIRYLRLKKDYSQEELSFKSDLSTNALSAIERGNYNIRIKTLYRIADALDVKIEDILNCQF